MKGFWIYILRCSDGSYYTGHSDDLEHRMAQHVSGEITGCYTFKLRPVELLFSQECTSREEALAAERKIKGWRRQKKEALINGSWAEIAHLSCSRHPGNDKA
ncbi:MAG: GIY-YIG nuclease family protein [Candidatus Accumulibacter sp.]|nr:GIY-YIG nuclease family protein [Accumulibacter sp.]